MLIDFINPIQPIDSFAQRGFIEILNLILLSEDSAELHRKLVVCDRDIKYRSLSGYYKWSFENYSFTLWQRIGYEKEQCFKDKILEVKHISMICQDRYRPNLIKN